LRKWSHEQEIESFSTEMRERAVRMVQEHRGEYPSLWVAIESIAPKVGCVQWTLLEWVKKAEVDSGVREGVTSAEREQLKALKRENREMRRANEILKLASAFLSKLRIRLFSPLRSSSAYSNPESLC